MEPNKTFYTRIDALDKIHFHHQFKVFTNIKRITNRSSYCILLLLSGDISLNPRFKNNLQPLNSNEWNVFKSKGLHLTPLENNSFLLKINELRYIPNFSSLGISESKLYETILQSEIQINNFDLLRTICWRCCLLYQKWYKRHSETILSWRLQFPDNWRTVWNKWTEESKSYKLSIALREKCPYSELFWSVFYGILIFTQCWFYLFIYLFICLFIYLFIFLFIDIDLSWNSEKWLKVTNQNRLSPPFT